MLTTGLFSGLTDRPHILCLGAHCDDIEIGCGGTLLKLLAAYPAAHITWIVFSSTDARKKEAENGAALFTGQAASLDLRILKFRDGFLPTQSVDLKETFEWVKRDIEVPDVIFTHYRSDLHQDHKIVSDLTWNTFRNHLIFEYEIPKWDGDLGRPSGYFCLTREEALRKIEYLQQAYNSQNIKNWFADDLFWSLMRLRGMECNSESTVAEAFYIKKVTFG